MQCDRGRAFVHGRSTAFFFVLAAIVARTHYARADAITLVPEPHQLAFGAELGYFAQEQDESTLYVFAPRVALHYAFDERFSIAGDYALIAIDSVPNVGSAEGVVRSGNASAFGLYRNQLAGARYTLALGGTVPIARIGRGDGRLQHAAFNDAEGMNGLWDVWLWAPDRAAAVGFASIAFPLEPRFELEFQTMPALLIPAYEAWGQDSVSVFVPTSAGVALERGPVRFGLRLQAVIMPTNNLDLLQLSLVPFVHVKLGAGFVEARYVGNVDEPLAGQRGPRIWGFHLGGGGVL